MKEAGSPTASFLLYQQGMCTMKGATNKYKRFDRQHLLIL